MSTTEPPTGRMRKSTQAEPYIGYTSKQGLAIQLVKWVRTADGWVHITERGQYITCDKQNWVIARWNGIVRLSRDEWHVILP
jgi:hypothetical protein